MKRKFYKMHGIGNDYIYFDCLTDDIELNEQIIIKLSDRRFGIGGDGVILIKPDANADARMEMYNSDGSRGKMCGNGIRCVGKYLYDSGIVRKNEISIQTDAGVKMLTIHEDKGVCSTVSVEMGEAVFDCASIPVLMDTDEYVNSPVTIGKRQYLVTCVSMGNPHCVTLVDFADAVDIERVGPMFEHNVLFPDRINTEFVQHVGKNEIKMRVWERGAGETFACGTGACAAAAASVRLGLCSKGREVKVHLKGGDLEVLVRDDFTVNMTGKAAMVFEGEVNI